MEEYLSDFKRVRTMVRGQHNEMLVADGGGNKIWRVSYKK